jgi:hypothetical protein
MAASATLPTISSALPFSTSSLSTTVSQPAALKMSVRSSAVAASRSAS